MSSTSDKISGVANETAGEVKRGVGKMLGSGRLQAEGTAQVMKGRGQRTIGNLKTAAKSVASKAADALRLKT